MNPFHLCFSVLILLVNVSTGACENLRLKYVDCRSNYDQNTLFFDRYSLYKCSATEQVIRQIGCFVPDSFEDQFNVFVDVGDDRLHAYRNAQTEEIDCQLLIKDKIGAKRTAQPPICYQCNNYTNDHTRDFSLAMVCIPEEINSGIERFSDVRDEDCTKFDPEGSETTTKRPTQIDPNDFYKCYFNETKTSVKNLANINDKWCSVSDKTCCIKLIHVRDYTSLKYPNLYPKIEKTLGFHWLARGFFHLSEDDLRILKKRFDPILASMYILEKLKACTYMHPPLEGRFLRLLEEKTNLLSHDCSI